MPTIIAICPYCRSGGVRAPDTALGDSATCPKCKSTYTVLPDDDLPDWAAKATPDAKFISAPSHESPRPAPVVERRATVAPGAARPDGGEPKAGPGGPTSADAKPRAATPAPPEAAPVAQPQAANEPPAEPHDTAAVLALAALILVGPAVVASQLPFGRFLALGLAGLGLVGGLLCLGAEGRARLFGAGAAALHFGVILLVLLLPSWLDLDPWGAPAAPEEPKGPVAVDHGTGKGVPVSPDEWLDAAKSSWQFHDARVSMRAGIGPVELTGPNGAKKTPKAYYLRLALQVRNVGHGREIPLSGWAAGQGAEGVRATDPAGKPLSPAKFESGWVPDAGKPAPRAMPGLASEVVLLFAAPPPKTEFVRVQLPGAALGEAEEIKLRSAVVVPARAPGK
jgi:hypothetical protein